MAALQKTQEEAGIAEDRQIKNDHLYVFGRAGGVHSDLLVKDIIEGNWDTTQGLQVKYPVCFDCFDKILASIDEKIAAKEQERITFSQ